MSLDAAFVLPFKAMTYQPNELQYICSGDRSGIGIRPESPDPRALRQTMSLPSSPVRMLFFGKLVCKLPPYLMQEQLDASLLLKMKFLST